MSGESMRGRRKQLLALILCFCFIAALVFCLESYRQCVKRIGPNWVNFDTSMDFQCPGHAPFIGMMLMRAIGIAPGDVIGGE